MINEALKRYIEENVLTQYCENDSGHGIEHIKNVTERCLKFASQFKNINADILYVAASFHDTAHHIDKKNHETLSAKMFYENEDMKAFFSENERQIIKEAIEDHRASSGRIPRSDYGKILSSADRSTDTDDFFARTHAYTMKHFPDSSPEDILERAYSHTYEKYGEQGYASHYVHDEDYELFRNEIALLLGNRELFDARYKKVNGMK